MKLSRWIQLFSSSSSQASVRHIANMRDTEKFRLVCGTRFEDDFFVDATSAPIRRTARTRMRETSRKIPFLLSLYAIPLNSRRQMCLTSLRFPHCCTRSNHFPRRDSHSSRIWARTMSPERRVRKRVSINQIFRVGNFQECRMVYIGPKNRICIFRFAC